MNDPISVVSGIPSSLQDETATLLERYAATRTEGVNTLADVPPGADIARAFACSPFIADFAIAQPHAFRALIADPLRRDAAACAVLVEQALADLTDTASAKAALRRIRRAEMVRIAWRDLVLGVDVVDIMAELSAFADAVVSRSVAWLQRQLRNRFGMPLRRDGAPLELMVLGMGKLGGHELNFSSDIDLMFVYDGDGDTVGGRKELTHQDYFDRLGRELIALLNEQTVDGFVFRVDMRLRPFGDSGPLSSSLGALEHYYTVHGRDWERYALIKARPLCGDELSMTALAAIVRPFVYRRYLDYGALDALREMKALINREASTRQLQDDVKRGRGGIREIEFTAQLFQLTRGGREPRLRQRSLLPTLAACAELGLLGPSEVQMLVDAYRFLRTTEHRLQQVHDRQTHALPGEAKGRARLAYALGQASWEAFAETLRAHRDGVSRLFSALLRADSARDPGGESRVLGWQQVWAAGENEDAVRRLLHEAGASGMALFELVRELHAERFRHRLSQNGQLRLDRLMPLLLELISTRSVREDTVRRLAQLLRAIAGRSVYLAFLADNAGALTRLIELFEASPWISEQIIRNPILMDELLDPRVLFAPPDQARLHRILGEQLAGADDLEAAMEGLRGFKNQQVLRVAASDVTGQFPVADISNQLTYVAEACVEGAVGLAWRDLVARHGEPRCVDGATERAAGFAVIAYGKLGGWELGYGSDLDLVFVHDSRGERQETSGAKVIENDVFFARLAQRLIHILSTTTPSGTAYEIDTRLRPSGAAGQLVVGIDALGSYLSTKAWVWEQQALVRARAIAGAAPLRERFAIVRSETLARPRGVDLAGEIVSMRQRMLGELDRSTTALFDLKHGRGGITDIEFMVQYAVLRWAYEHPTLLVWTDNLRLLETIADLGLIPATQCRDLHDAYFAYRADLHACALQQIDGLVEEQKFQQHRARVTAIWGALLELRTQETTP